ncbi:Fc.00g082210.m01.CDS01 [Cosmosporella sp. VM-42]
MAGTADFIDNFSSDQRTIQPNMVSFDAFLRVMNIDPAVMERGGIGMLPGQGPARVIYDQKRELLPQEEEQDSAYIETDADYDEEFRGCWPKACVFFCHDATDRRQGVRLPGFSRPLRPASMVKIYSTLLAWTMGTEEIRHKLDRSEEVAKMGILALCWKAFDLCAKAKHEGDEDALVVERECCVQCACRAKSLTMSVCIDTIRAPQIIFAEDDNTAAEYLDIVNRTYGVDGGQEQPWRFIQSILLASVLLAWGLDITRAANYRPERSLPPSSITADASRKGRSSTSASRKRSSSQTGAHLPSSKRSCSVSPTKDLSTLPNRVHRRVILRDYGIPIYKASSRSALLAAFGRCIEGHESLHKAGFLHRDISINNLMINEDDENPSLPSFLIDLDLAIKESREAASGAKGKTGTRAFMAIGALLGEQHSFMHDLESFFWVLFWICIHYNGADEARVVLEFDKWNYVDTGELANLKKGQVSHEGDFIKTAEENFTSYYQPLVT